MADSREGKRFKFRANQWSVVTTGIPHWSVGHGSLVDDDLIDLYSSVSGFQAMEIIVDVEEESLSNFESSISWPQPAAEVDIIIVTLTELISRHVTVCSHWKYIAYQNSSPRLSQLSSQMVDVTLRCHCHRLRHYLFRRHHLCLCPFLYTNRSTQAIFSLVSVNFMLSSQKSKIQVEKNWYFWIIFSF